MTNADDRPDPNALLAAAKAEGSGRLKVFLGAAPGVGKTYAMLEAAQARKAEGIDVVAGIIETHGRDGTAGKLDGFEVLARRKLAHRGREIDEFDIDTALARRPGLLLVDELAHTNAPGSRHPKRYQDVEELLAAGIDVWTTLNVQHLESLNDIVAKITGVRVQETLPDSVLERADAIELVDLTPDDLIKRLKEGKIYKGANAERAADHFFRPGNLTALRELALRRTAERVDDQMVGLMLRQAIPGPWPAGERILACISAFPDPAPIVRAARRLADQIGAKWMAVNFETPHHASLDETAKTRIADALKLADRLGGEARVIPTSDVVAEILDLARGQNITQIVIGKTRRPRWREWFGRSLVHELIRANDAVGVHIVPSDGPSVRERLTAALRVRLAARAARGPRPFIEATGAVFVAAGLCWLLRMQFDTPNVEPILLLTSIIYTAVRFGLSPSLYASLLATLVFDFFFVEPYLTLTIGDPRDILALAIFVVIAVLLSSQASRVREQATDARRRFRTTAALYDFARKLAAAAALDDLVWIVAHQVATMLGVGTVVLLGHDGRLVVRGGYPPEDDLPAGDWAAAHWARDKGEPAGLGSGTLPSAERLYVPMRTAAGPVGVLGIRPPKDKSLDPDARRLLDALADQAAIAIGRMNLDAEMREAKVLAESEKLRAALLSSISHDLGTPLATITGAVSTLRTGSGLNEAARCQLLEAIHEESDRLARFVGNLLDMTRLEGGALLLRRDWADPRELVGTAVARLRKRLPAREVRISAAPGLPLLRVDPTLLGQALYNLLDNAAKYTPDGMPIAVTISVAGSRLRIAIEDHGRGVPATDLERVFDKFYRVRGGQDGRWGDRQIAGTGLGLAICRGLVEAHGGSVRLESPISDGYGTRATVDLPVDPQPDDARPEPR
jgi:two-component system sensor histidine kinase KdpD